MKRWVDTFALVPTFQCILPVSSVSIQIEKQQIRRDFCDTRGISLENRVLRLIYFLVKLNSCKLRCLDQASSSRQTWTKTVWNKNALQKKKNTRKFLFPAHPAKRGKQGKHRTWIDTGNCLQTSATRYFHCVSCVLFDVRGLIITLRDSQFNSLQSPKDS